VPSGLSDPFNRYRALLAAVPDTFRRQPAVLAGVDAGEPWPDADTGWVTAAATNVRDWNLDGGRGGARVVALLLNRWSPEAPLGIGGKPGMLADIRTAWETLETPLRSRAAHATAAPSIAAAGQRPAMAGKGLFVQQLWEVEGGDGAVLARRARALGLSFLVVKLAHREQPYLLRSAEEQTARAVAALARSGLAVWGWSVVSGERPELEAAVVADRSRSLGLAGWVVEPAAGYPSEAAAPFLGIVRLARPGLPLALLLRREAAEAGLALAPPMAVLMPAVSSAGQVGTAAVEIGRFGRPIVPVLELASADREIAPDAAEARAFLATAAHGGRRGAALLAWDHCLHSADGLEVLRAAGALAWSNVRPDTPATTPTPAPLRAGAEP
jgi:hypothetical protein